MTEQELLEKVKIATNYTGDFQNDFISGWIDFAQSYMANSGVADEALNSKGSVGVIAQIITDMIDSGGLTPQTERLVAQFALTYPRKEA